MACGSRAVSDVQDERGGARDGALGVDCLVLHQVGLANLQLVAVGVKLGAEGVLDAELQGDGDNDGRVSASLLVLLLSSAGSAGSSTTASVRTTVVALGWTRWWSCP